MLARLKAFFNPPNPNPLRAPARIFWAGFLNRVLYITLAHTYRFRVIDEHFEFGWEMGRIARSLATGHGFASPFNGNSGPSAWTPPLYPLIIAGAFRVFGVYSLKAAWAILTVNSVLSAATAPAIYEMAWRCFGRTRPADRAGSAVALSGANPNGLSIALWSAWIWALYPAAMQYAVRWVWDMSLTCFLFTWVLVFALRLRGVGEDGFEVQGSSVGSQCQARRCSAVLNLQPTTCNLQLPGLSSASCGDWSRCRTVRCSRSFPRVDSGSSGREEVLGLLQTCGPSPRSRRAGNWRTAGLGAATFLRSLFSR